MLRLDSKAAEPIVRELYCLWVSEGRYRLSLSRKARIIYEKFGLRLSRWQVYRLEKQFKLGNVWVDEQGRVRRKPRGIVAEQERFIEEYYRLGLDPHREVFREAMRRIQTGQTSEQVLNSILDGEIRRLMVEKAIARLRGEAPPKDAKRLYSQNLLIGAASAHARYLLCKKYKMVGRVPMKEHRKLTGKILRRWLKNPELMRTLITKKLQ